jgi:hypothetical protein
MSFDFGTREVWRVAHKVPCKECPYRKTSAPGWLGPDPLEAYTTAIQLDVPISCHRTRGKKKRPAMCAGSVIHLNNQVKVPRDPVFAGVVVQYGKSDAVFRWTNEFVAHHTGGWLNDKKELKKR